MAQFTKLVMGLIAASCLQMSLADKVLAQLATDLDIDRATVKSVVNLQRFMPMSSDLDQDQDPGMPKASPTNDTNVLRSPIGPKPAFSLPGGTTSSGNVVAPAGASGLPANSLTPANSSTSANSATPANSSTSANSSTAANSSTPANSSTSANPSNLEGRAIAQAPPPPSTNADIVPIDLTPVRLPERNNTFNGFDAFRSRGLYWLPSKFFCDLSLENSLRFELNTFQTNRHYLSDMIYRVLPNISAGYALTKRTRVSANYFFLRDQYDKRNKALSRNFQSVGARIDHDIKIDEKTTITAGFMPRVLFINTSHQPGIVYNDLLPSGVITRRINNGVLYGSVIGQIRFRDILSRFQEGDQFFSVGGSKRYGKWTYLADSTLVTNFGNSHLRQGPNNQNIIMTFEAGKRIFPYITAFARAQPIFNMGANHSPGYAGFNFRIFGGLRAEIGKPPIFPVKLKS